MKNSNPTHSQEQKKADEIRQSVRQSYSRVAEGKANSSDCCAPSTKSNGGCCDGSRTDEILSVYSARLGYSEAELKNAPKGADLGLGCGNPRAIASLKPGEVVLDLGSGAGFDCFLAALEVGPTGHVIGIDMTPAMLSKARDNAAKANATQVEFRLGEIEHLPVADQSVDVIISNCVINLSPNKPQVFREAMRVLKSGGRLAISDVVASTTIPEQIRADLALYSGCIAGAAVIDDLVQMLESAGFTDIVITPQDASREFIKDWAPGRRVEDYVVSASIEAVKPTADCCGSNCCS